VIHVSEKGPQIDLPSEFNDLGLKEAVQTKAVKKGGLPSAQAPWKLWGFSTKQEITTYCASRQVAVNELSLPVYEALKRIFKKEGRALMDEYIAMIKGSGP